MHQDEFRQVDYNEPMHGERQTSSTPLWCFQILVLSILVVSPVAAGELDSLKDLREFLRGEPYVNRGTDDKLTPLPDETQVLITKGRAVYAKHCAACHGDNLQGQPNWNTRQKSGLLPAPPHNETGHTWHHADDQLFEFVKYGPTVAVGDPKYRSSMPSFADVLEDDNIFAVLVYIRSTWPEELRRWQAGTNDFQSEK
ncbi:MAG: cytochrome c [Arenicellales bacterium]